MFWHIVRFELKYRFRRVSTYVYFAIWFLMAFFAVSVRQFGPGSLGGKVFVNSPFTIAQLMTSMMALGIIVVSAIFGTSIYRDFEEDTYQLLFTTPLRRRDYLGGRFIGSMMVSVLIFSGLIWRLLVGAFMPWADQSRLAHIDLWFHLQPFLLFVGVEIFFAGALFFAIGALTRNIVFVYLQGVVLLALYLVALELVSLNPDNLNSFWPAVLDPFCLMTLGRATRYWTVVEKNTLTIPLTEVVLWNRLLWTSLGALAIAALRFFPFSVEALTSKRKRKQTAAKDSEDQKSAGAVPSIGAFAPRFGRLTTRSQLASLTRLRLLSIVKEVPFIALVLIGMVLVFIDGSEAGRLLDTPVYPVTYIMAELVRDQFVLFLLIITTIYAGELVWKERGLKYDQIHDAAPIPSWLNFTSSLIALTAVQVVLLAVLMASGVALQAFQGYYRFELHIYFKELFLIGLPDLILFSVFALFLQTVLSNKFLGHALLVGVFLGQGVMSRYGFEDALYQFGELPDYTYSDMNGYGHFVVPLLWFTLYWTACAAILATVCVLFTRRGADNHWRARIQQAAERWRLPVNALAAACLMGFVSLGAYIFYNTHRVNEFQTNKTNRVKQASYEKAYKKYEGLAQPKIIAIDLKVDIFPDRRSFASTGTFTLVNKSGEAIPAIHIRDTRESLREVTFDRAFRETLADKPLRYHIYTLADPLEPNETLRLNFSAAHDSKGFRSSNDPPEFAFNGTFFDSDYFPRIGYQRDAELEDDDERRDQELGPAPDLPRPIPSSGSGICLQPTLIGCRSSALSAPIRIKPQLRPATCYASGLTMAADTLNMTWAIRRSPTSIHSYLDDTRSNATTGMTSTLRCITTRNTSTTSPE